MNKKEVLEIRKPRKTAQLPVSAAVMWIMKKRKKWR